MKSPRPRFSTTATSHEKIAGDWWQVTTQSRLVDSAVWATQIHKQRLNSGNEIQSLSIDPANQSTTSATLTNRSNQTRVTTTTGVGGSVVTTECSNRTVKRQLPGALVPEYTFYDTFGRLKGTIDARSATTRYSYYSLTQQVQRVTNPLGEPVTYTYHPPGHHAAGKIWKQTDAAGKTTETLYDLFGRVFSTAGSATYPVTHTYNGYGDPETLTTYGTQTATTTWVRDGATGLLLEKKYHGQSNGVKYTYRSDGRVASRTWRRGIRTDYGYTPSGDLETITYSDNTPDVVFSNFDRLGRPHAVTEGGEITTHTYDALTGEASTTYAIDHDFLPYLSLVTKSPNSGRPGGYTLKQGSTPLQDVSYGYDAASGLLDEITSGGHQIGYQYYPGTGILEKTTHSVTGSGTPRIETRAVDLAGRTTGVLTTVPGGIAASAGYLLNNRGQREKLTREDGTSWNYAYNDRGEVTSGVKKLANGSLAAGLQFGYQYDGIGNREWAKSGGNASGQNQRTVNHTPNALNQYSQIATPGSFDVLVRSPQAVGVAVNGAGVAVGSQGDYYRAEATATNTSGAWAELTVTSPVGQNSVTGHRWLPPASFNPVHDDDGNLTDDGRWTNTWDAENRLIAQTTTARAIAAGVPRLKVENTYDWRSRRIGKKVSSSTNGTAWTVVSDERFVYDGWNPIAVFNASGGTLTAKQTCLWGLDLSGTLQGAGGVGGLLSVTINNQPSTINLFPSYDGNGNIVAWTDSSGITKQRIDYDPFGNVVTREGVAGFEAPAWGFSTKYQDKETGLLYYGFRFYDPVTGRWPSRDPIEEEGGINLYGFVGNDGTNGIDFLGLVGSGVVPMNDGRWINGWTGEISGKKTSKPGSGIVHDGSVESFIEHSLNSDNNTSWKLTSSFLKQGSDYYMKISYLNIGPDVIEGNTNGSLKKSHPELFKEICAKRDGQTIPVSGVIAAEWFCAQLPWTIGRLNIRLDGTLKKIDNSKYCGWKFEGKASAIPELFDFDDKVRPDVTTARDVGIRIVNFAQKLGSKRFMVKPYGTADVNAIGNCK